MNERPDWQPVRGTRDVLPPEQARLHRLAHRLDDALAQWGYAPLDVPLLERRELYLKKAGEELVGKLYDFVHHGRALALRPEWTASVLRAYLRGLQAAPLPVRLRYAGPVLRYERPQRGTYRQFTQVGVELIGGLAPRADAEVIALACAGLDAVAVPDWTLMLGHVGVARSLLGGLGLPERTASQLLWSMERLRRDGVAPLATELTSADPDELFDLGPLAALPDEQLQDLLVTMLRAVGLPLANSTRSPEAIVGRLVRKLRRGSSQPAVERALERLTSLSAARGQPDVAIGAAAAILQSEGLPTAPLDELRTTLALLADYGVDPGRITVDLGLTRGLHYYTGMIFEINGADGLQLCGGGRYDDLVASLGGPSVPAVGCAYGLERIAAAAQPDEAGTAPLVVVMAADVRYGAALRAAALLRARGYQAQLDVRGRALQGNLRDAAKRGAVAVLAIEDDETATWHAGQTARRGDLETLVPAL